MKLFGRQIPFRMSLHPSPRVQYIVTWMFVIQGLILADIYFAMSREGRLADDTAWREKQKERFWRFRYADDEKKRRAQELLEIDEEYENEDDDDDE
jgi:hypothetical protein